MPHGSKTYYPLALVCRSRMEQCDGLGRPNLPISQGSVGFMARGLASLRLYSSRRPRRERRI